MTVLFSASTGFFYDDQINSLIPDDAYEISAEVRDALLARQSNGRQIVADTNGLPILADPPLPSAAALCAGIDAAADAARKAVAGDPLRAVEYERAAAEAKTFKDAGYPASAVPRSVAAWTINGRTPQQAADDILTEADRYTEMLYRLREVRLQAKEQVRAQYAAGNTAMAQQVASETMVKIQTTVSGVGNAGA